MSFTGTVNYQTQIQTFLPYWGVVLEKWESYNPQPSVKTQILTTPLPPNEISLTVVHTSVFVTYRHFCAILSLFYI